MRLLPCLLLLSGSGQNTGKTTMGCCIVERVSAQTEVYALKISPHFYDPGPDLPVVAWGSGFVIYEEIHKNSPKDSSRFLAAGATRVFFVTSDREHVGSAMKEALKHVPSGIPLVCESGGVAKFYKPGLHVHLGGNHSNKPCLGNPDIIIGFDGEKCTPHHENIRWGAKGWIVEKTL